MPTAQTKATEKWHKTSTGSSTEAGGGELMGSGPGSPARAPTL